MALSGFQIKPFLNSMHSNIEQISKSCFSFKLWIITSITMTAQNTDTQNRPYDRFKMYISCLCVNSKYKSTVTDKAQTSSLRVLRIHITHKTQTTTMTQTPHIDYTQTGRKETHLKGWRRSFLLFARSGLFLPSFSLL